MFLSVENCEALFDWSQRSGINSFGREKFSGDRYALHWLNEIFVLPGSHSLHTIPPSVGVTLGRPDGTGGAIRKPFSITADRYGNFPTDERLISLSSSKLLLISWTKVARHIGFFSKYPVVPANADAVVSLPAMIKILKVVSISCNDILSSFFGSRTYDMKSGEVFPL